MAIGDPPGGPVRTEHPDGSYTVQDGYITDQVQYGEPFSITGVKPDVPEPDISSEPEGTWWQRNRHWITLGLGALGSVATGTWLPAAIGALGTLANTWLQNKYNEENYQKQKQDALDAEQRANDEYDRRQADARQYNDSWADRLRSQGFNPLAAISKGGGVTSSAASAPSTTSMPLRQARRSGIGSIGSSMSNVLGMLSTAQALKQQQAQTAYIEAQTANTQAKTKAVNQDVDSFWTRFNNEMALMTANLRNQNAVADINESMARIQTATEQNQIDSFKYECLTLYYNMKSAEFSPQIANKQLAILGEQYLIEQLRRQITSNDLVLSGNSVEASNMNLVELKQYYAKRAEIDAVAREVSAGITAVEEQAARLAKDNNWYGADKVFGYISAVGHTVAAIASVAKPGALPANSTTTTTTMQDGTTIRRQQYYR